VKIKLSGLLIAGYFGLALILVLLAGLMPSERGRVAVLQFPWSDQSAVETVARAGGQIHSASASGYIAITQSENEGFVWHLYQEGAGVVISASAAAACVRLIETVKRTDANA